MKGTSYLLMMYWHDVEQRAAAAGHRRHLMTSYFHCTSFCCHSSTG